MPLVHVVGICMYDDKLKIGGLLHAMPPNAYEKRGIWRYEL